MGDVGEMHRLMAGEWASRTISSYEWHLHWEGILFSPYWDASDNLEIELPKEINTNRISADFRNILVNFSSAGFWNLCTEVHYFLIQQHKRYFKVIQRLMLAKKLPAATTSVKQRTCVHILAKLWEILVEYSFFPLSIKHKHKDFKFYHGPFVMPEFLIPHLWFPGQTNHVSERSQKSPQEPSDCKDWLQLRMLWG